MEVLGRAEGRPGDLDGGRQAEQALQFAVELKGDREIVMEAVKRTGRRCSTPPLHFANGGLKVTWSWCATSLASRGTPSSRPSSSEPNHCRHPLVR